jgi:hypothetical protein
MLLLCAEKALFTMARIHVSRWLLTIIALLASIVVAYAEDDLEQRKTDIYSEGGKLQGGPIREKFLLYDAVEDAAKAKGCAMLFIATEKEELFNNKDHPEAAFHRAAEPKQYVVIPDIDHYRIYNQARKRASDFPVA